MAFSLVHIGSMGIQIQDLTHWRWILLPYSHQKEDKEYIKGLKLSKCIFMTFFYLSNPAVSRCFFLPQYLILIQMIYTLSYRYPTQFLPFHMMILFEDFVFVSGANTDYRDGFTGCIRALLLNGRHVDLVSYAKKGLYGEQRCNDLYSVYKIEK